MSKRTKSGLSVIVVTLLCIIVVGTYIYLHKDGTGEQAGRSPLRLTSLCGVTLQDTKDGLISKFGEPMIKKSYPEEEKESLSFVDRGQEKKDMVVVKLVRGRIKAVLCHNDEIDGIRAGTELKNALRKLGDPSYVSSSPTDKMKIYNFAEHNAILGVKDGNVTGVGMLSPAFDPLMFTDDPNR